MTKYALSNGKEIGPTPRACWVIDGKFIAGITELAEQLAQVNKYAN
tara:strand:- start:729 stop:866 length:138 start_codon:yes stop_codon:yes gene_type:complete